MPTDLLEAFAEMRARIQQFVAVAGLLIWDALHGHDREDIPEFLEALLPTLEAGQREGVTLTDAYIAAELGRQALGVRPEGIIAGIRGDVSPDVVYGRPFVTLWRNLGQGRSFAEANALARQRLETALAMDVLLATTRTAALNAALDPGLRGFERVAHAGACELCRAANGTETILLQIHPDCQCIGRPVRANEPDLPRELPGGVETREHGEYGPVLVDPAHAFSTRSTGAEIQT